MTRLGIWDDPGPDRGWSWVIAFGTCGITFCSYGFSRSCGVLFVAIVENFGVSRREAAWPFNLAPAVACFSAVVAGVLTRFLTSRQTVFLGASLCFIGVTLCFFATSVTWFVVCYGIIYGFGLALCVPLLLGILNEYFVRHRATANGIYLSGSTIGLLSLPPLLDYLISVYGLRGTMLIQAGLVLHIFVGASLLRGRNPDNFPILKRRLKTTNNSEEKTLLDGAEQPRVFRLNSETGSFKVDLQGSEKLMPEANDNVNGEMEENHLQKQNGEAAEAEVLVSRSNSKASIRISKEVSLSRRGTANSVDGKSIIQASLNGSVLFGLDTIGTITKENASKKDPAKEPSYFAVVRDIFMDPCFYMVLVSGAACFVPLLTFMIIIMDFGMDRGLPREKAVLLMSAISIPELLGRFCFGWISDKGYLKYKTLFMCSKTIGAVLLFITPTFGYYAGLFVISGIYGAVESCAVTILNVLFVEYLGLEKLPIAFSWSIFVDGFIFLGMPSVIGLFRDSFGCYDFLFYLLGALNLLSVVVWFLEPLVIRKRNSMAEARKEQTASSSA